MGFFNLIAALHRAWLPWALNADMVGQGPLLGGSLGAIPCWGGGQMMVCPSLGTHGAPTAHITARSWPGRAWSVCPERCVDPYGGGDRSQPGEDNGKVLQSRYLTWPSSCCGETGPAQATALSVSPKSGLLTSRSHVSHLQVNNTPVT